MAPRGAVLVDRDTRPALGNVERLGLGERAELVRADVGRWLAAPPEDPDAAASTSSLSMPPIDSPTAWRRTWTPICRGCSPRGRAIVESGARSPLRIESLERLRQRRYGAADVSIYAEAEQVSERNGTVVCPGSYDPVTNGHIDIITRTSNVFDRVVVGVVNNPVRKQKTLFNAEERRDFIAAATADLPNVEVQIFATLLVEFARDNGAKAIVKGLRAISDFEYEFEMAQLNRKLDPGIESIYVIASPHYSFLSSTGVKEMATFGGDVSDLVPAPVAAALADRLDDR